MNFNEIQAIVLTQLRLVLDIQEADDVLLKTLLVELPSDSLYVMELTLELEDALDCIIEESAMIELFQNSESSVLDLVNLIMASCNGEQIDNDAGC